MCFGVCGLWGVRVPGFTSGFLCFFDVVVGGRGDSLGCRGPKAHTNATLTHSLFGRRRWGIRAPVVGGSNPLRGVRLSDLPGASKPVYKRKPSNTSHQPQASLFGQSPRMPFFEVREIKLHKLS